MIEGKDIARINAILDLDKGQGPSRDLDRRIAIAVGAKHGPLEVVEYETRSVSYFDEIAPHYTASLDCAAELVPEGCEWSVGLTHDGNGIASVWEAEKNEEWHCEAPTPPVALCLVALRARKWGDA